MEVRPQAPRYALENTPDGLRVVIPAPRTALAIAFFGLWLVGWFLGERNAWAQLLGLTWHGVPVKHVQPEFLAFWLVMWTFGGVAVAITLLWQLAGKEIISANSVSLSRRIETLGLGFTRSYTLREIRDLRATPYVDPRYSRQRVLFPWSGGPGSGAIAFDYGARTVRIAPGLDEAEAKMLVADLTLRLKVQQTAVSML